MTNTSKNQTSPNDNSECNTSSTIDRNILLAKCKTDKQREFLKLGLERSLDSGGFSFLDFPNYTKNNFRQMILKLKRLGLVELVTRSSIAIYKVKGVARPLDFRRITFDRMGVGENMLPILRMVRNQPPSIHDLKIKFESKDLHKFLKDQYPVNPTNKGIILNRKLGDFLDAKILVYPPVVQIDLACTFKPFVYDVGSALDLLMNVGKLHEYLHSLTMYRAEDLPSPLMWVVTQYHFGKDGTESLSGPKFERTFQDVVGGFIRFYAKTMQDGRVIPRLEMIVTPNHTLKKQVELMMAEELNSSTCE